MIAKDHELRQAVKDHDSQLTQVTQSLAEYKHRVHRALVVGVSVSLILRVTRLRPQSSLDRVSHAS